MSSLIGYLFEKLGSWFSGGAKKLVDYVHYVVKNTSDYVSKKVLDNLSRLRNIWNLLKGCISSAVNYVKEKCFEGIQFMMKWIMKLFKWLSDLVISIITPIVNVSKGVSKCAITLVKSLRKMTTILSQSSPVSDFEKMKMKGSTERNQKTPDYGDSLFCLIVDLIRLLMKHLNTSVNDGIGMYDLVEGLLDGFALLVDIISLILYDSCYL
ncbi:hypothetical protein LIER_25134 [Lithospermum erythrorhizon]|uniref:Uncharacterized protein n=1 Tax=Lithospermum erythrorhizon TaxID=34254 RepID=A0AAV3R6W9_LITER